MANKSVIATIRGKLSYFKMFPDQLHLNYGKDGKEWSTDLILTKEGVADMKSLGISKKVKKKDEYADGQPYVRFTIKEFNSKEEPSRPVEVVDILGNPWPTNDKLGNGTVVDVTFAVVDYGQTQGAYIRRVRVLDHVPYNAAAPAPLSEEDEYFAKYAEAQKKAEEGKALKKFEQEEFKRDFQLADDDLDDEIPE